ALNEAGETDAVVAAVDQLAVEFDLLVPAGLLQAPLERLGIVAAVAERFREGLARLDRRQLERHLIEPDQIAPAQFETVDAEVLGRQVHQPVHEEAALEA